MKAEMLSISRLARRLAVWLAIGILCPGISIAKVTDLRPGVVRVIVTSPAHKTGAGFVVSRTSAGTYIVTAAHVVENADAVSVQFFPGELPPVGAHVRNVEFLNPEGMALLRVTGAIPAEVLQLSLAKDSSVRAGEAIATIGHQASTGSWGVITGTVSSRAGRRITIQAPIEEQTSGGPLLRENQVVGLVVSARTNFGYAITAAAVREYVKGFGVALGKSAPPTVQPAPKSGSSVSKIEAMWEREGCGRAVLHGDSIVNVRLTAERGRSLVFEVDHMVDPGHANGTDGIQRSKPMLYANFAVLPVDNNGEGLWKTFGPGRAVRSGPGTASTTVALRADMPILRSKYLFVSLWEVGIMNGFKLCKIIPFERSW